MSIDWNPALAWLGARAANLAAALALLVVGWIVAHFARSAVKRAAGRFAPDRRDAVWTRILHIGQELLFWFILLVFVLAAIDVARVAMPGGWLERISGYLPRLIAAAAIVIVGAMLGLICRDLTLRALPTSDQNRSRLIARAVQLAVLLTAFVVAVDQLGIRVTFPVTIIAIGVAGGVFAIALAFALGAAELARNLLGARDARHHYAPGQRIRVGSVEGELVEISSSMLVLATADGRVTVPAKAFHDSAIVLLRVGPDHG